MRRFAPRAQPGFTVIELLVVISIIGILVALLLVVLGPILSKGPELQTVNELRQLTMAVNNFKAKYGVYPPSRITLSASYKVMMEQDPASLGYLSAIWPRLEWNDPSVILDWAGTGLPRNTLLQKQHVYLLEGDQCLVFFLGGIPNEAMPGCRGFSDNPKNPTEPYSQPRVSFYEFDSGRLFSRTKEWADLYPPHPPLAPPHYKWTKYPMFYSYKDPWDTQIPYVYFSSGKTKNGYNASTPGDCDSLMPRGPYYEAGINPIRYFNSGTFQIISAGQDGYFGPGGAWSPGTAASIGVKLISPPIVTGVDDQANFYDARLGVPK